MAGTDQGLRAVEGADVKASSPSDFKEKIRSLSFVSKGTPSKVTYDHTDTAVVRTTEKNESQDVHITMNDAVRPHWKEET